MYQPCIIWEQFVRKSEEIDCPWHSGTLTKLFNLIKHMPLLLMVEGWFGIGCYTTRKQSKTSHKPFNLTKKTPCIGTIELAATGTQEGMY
jgi:hypothetical protein